MIPMPMPRIVCRTNLYNEIVQLEVSELEVQFWSWKFIFLEITSLY